MAEFHEVFLQYRLEESVGAMMTQPEKHQLWGFCALLPGLCVVGVV